MSKNVVTMSDGRGHAWIAALLLLFLLPLVPSMAKEKPKKNDGILPSAESAMFVTQVGDTVNITWNAQSNRIYSIIFTDDPRNATGWKILPGYGEVKGTGQQQTVTLTQVTATRRTYRVQFKEAGKDGKKKK